MINLAPSGLTAASGQKEGGSIPGLIFDTVEVVGDGGNGGCDDGLRQLMSNDFMVTSGKNNGTNIPCQGQSRKYRA